MLRRLLAPSPRSTLLSYAHHRPSSEEHAYRRPAHSFSLSLPSTDTSKHTPTRPAMSSQATSTYRRRLGRAPSPPTWLWYEQIPYDDDSSCSDEDRSDCDDYDDHDDRSCSEDDEDYAQVHGHALGNPVAPASESGSNSDSGESGAGGGMGVARRGQESGLNEKMDVEAGDHHKGAAGGDVVKKDLKGKQRAVDPEMDEAPRRRERERRRKREPVITLRPILTIQKSQGFVWNQVSTLSLGLFIEGYLTLILHFATLSGPFCPSVYQRPLCVVYDSATCAQEAHYSILISISILGTYNMTS